MFCINEFTDEIQDELRAQFAAICHGEDYAGSGRTIYNYRNTVKEFKKGMKERLLESK